MDSGNVGEESIEDVSGIEEDLGFSEVNSD